MIVVIDNYDSFVETLARYVRECSGETTLIRNDQITPTDVLALKPSGIVLSPGPGTPENAGICLSLLEHLIRSSSQIPVFGVCLGHQAMIAHENGHVLRAKRPLHGEASAIKHDGAGIFRGLSSPLSVGRYHSLIGELPASCTNLEVCAWSDDDEVMAVRRYDSPWHGVQFHPESLLTKDGIVMIQNFVDICSTGEKSVGKQSADIHGTKTA
ncbi:MAG: aminodeoxychorismate/anthranilate synthase component II [Pseudomonadota bacterium]